MASNQKFSHTAEEYLEHIYRLEKKHGVARTKILAGAIGVSLGTVTNTVEALERRKLVVHKPYKGVKLTETGRKIALKVIRRHRLSERLLTDFFKICWSDAHDHACRLEHVITSELSKPLEKELGHPKTCPHGNPIPTVCGGIFEEESMPLVDIDDEYKYVVVKVVDERSELLKYLSKIGLVPGSRIEVVEKTPFNGPLTLEIDGKSHSLSREIASLIWVRKESEDIGDASD